MDKKEKFYEPSPRIVPGIAAARALELLSDELIRRPVLRPASPTGDTPPGSPVMMSRPREDGDITEDEDKRTKPLLKESLSMMPTYLPLEAGGHLRTFDLMENIPVQKEYFTEERHNRKRNAEGKYLPSRVCRVAKWKDEKRTKTVGLGLVVCLNLGILPPGVFPSGFSPQGRANTVAWIDTDEVDAKNALEQMAENLQAQYTALHGKGFVVLSLDPTPEDVKKTCEALRRMAKTDRTIFHYHALGVPPPTPDCDIWAFNTDYSEYQPIALYDVRKWLGAPSMLILDCHGAGAALDGLQDAWIQFSQDFITAYPDVPAPVEDHIVLAACSGDERLPMHQFFPADIFTSILTTPMKIALMWARYRFPLSSVDQLMIEAVTGTPQDRKTPLGQLYWVFTAIADTIAWNLLSKEEFWKLFRQDTIVSSLMRNYLLAERVMRSLGCTPQCYPPLPYDTYNHPLWKSWDMYLELCLMQIQSVYTKEQKGATYNFDPTPFFKDQLEAFGVWLELATENTATPVHLPIVLQVILSISLRKSALTLLATFLSKGPWAVNMALSVGIFPYIIKLLEPPAKPDLRDALLAIWCKLLAHDRSCKVEIVKAGLEKYFLAQIKRHGAESQHIVHALFCLTVLCDDHPAGKASLVKLGFSEPLHGLLLSNNSDVRRWACLALGLFWENNEPAKEAGAKFETPERLCLLLADPSPEARSAAIFALGTFTGGTDEPRIQQETNLALHAVKLINDGSPLVREELCLLLSSLLRSQKESFATIAYIANEIQSGKSRPPPLTRHREIDEKEGVIAPISPRGAAPPSPRIVASPHAPVSPRGAPPSPRDFFPSSFFSPTPAVPPSPTSRRLFSFFGSSTSAATVSSTSASTVASTPSSSSAAIAVGGLLGGGSAASMVSSTVLPSVASSSVSSFASAAASSLASLPPLATSSAAGFSLRRSASAIWQSISSPPPPSASSVSASSTTAASAASSSTAAIGSFALNRSRSASAFPSTPTKPSSLPPTASVPASSSFVSASSRSISLASLRSTSSSSPSAPTPTSPSNAMGQRHVRYPLASDSYQDQRLLASRTIIWQSVLILCHDPYPDIAASASKLRHYIADVSVKRVTSGREGGLRRSHTSPQALQTLGKQGRDEKRELEPIAEDDTRLARSRPAISRENPEKDDNSSILDLMPKSSIYARSSEFVWEKKYSAETLDHEHSRQWRHQRHMELVAQAETYIHPKFGFKKSDMEDTFGSFGEISTLESGWKNVQHMLFHPIEDLLVATDGKQRIGLWNTRDCELLNTFSNENDASCQIGALRWINDHHHALLAVGSGDGVVRIWRYPHLHGKQELITAFAAIRQLHSMVRAGLVLDWHSASNRLVTAGSYQLMRIWDVEREQCVRDIPTGTHNSITCICSDPGEQVVYAGAKDGSVRLFDLRSQKALKLALSNHLSKVIKVHLQAGDPNGRLVSAAHDGDIVMCDSRMTRESYRQMFAFDKGKQPLAALAVHDYAPLFAVGSSKEGVRITRTNGSVIYNFKSHKGIVGSKIPPVRSLQFHPMRLQLAVGGTTTKSGEKDICLLTGVPSHLYG